MRHSPRRLSLFVLALVALVPAISPASTSALDAPAPKSETKKTSPLWLDAEAVTKIQIQEESDPLMRDLLTAIKRNAGKIAPSLPPSIPHGKK